MPRTRLLVALVLAGLAPSPAAEAENSSEKGWLIIGLGPRFLDVTSTSRDAESNESVLKAGRLEPLTLDVLSVSRDHQWWVHWMMSQEARFAQVGPNFNSDGTPSDDISRVWHSSGEIVGRLEGGLAGMVLGPGILTPAVGFEIGSYGRSTSIFQVGGTGISAAIGAAYHAHVGDRVALGITSLFEYSSFGFAARNLAGVGATNRAYVDVRVWEFIGVGLQGGFEVRNGMNEDEDRYSSFAWYWGVALSVRYQSNWFFGPDAR